MSIFGKIRDAIFGHKAAEASPTDVPANGAEQSAPQVGQGQPAPSAVPVDVEQVLANIRASKGNPDLNYKTSIVDLMKLLDMDSSLENRKELATELDYKGPKDGSVEMNLWLHREVMRLLAANGGKVPQILLH